MKTQSKYKKNDFTYQKNLNVIYSCWDSLNSRLKAAEMDEAIELVRAYLRQIKNLIAFRNLIVRGKNERIC